mmetsp:Transcript_24116/g.75650  ORF Transcript_24116/g.75650 Transcript_24116/m.75650 type:complete len:215 (+) Transcript_24116:813-1457(+)
MRVTSEVLREKLARSLSTPPSSCPPNAKARCRVPWRCRAAWIAPESKPEERPMKSVRCNSRVLLRTARSKAATKSRVVLLNCRSSNSKSWSRCATSKAPRSTTRAELGGTRRDAERRKPRRVSALRKEATAKRRPRGCSAYHRGFVPKASRASVARPRSKSKTARANSPSSERGKRGPSAAYAGSSTSPSERGGAAPGPAAGRRDGAAPRARQL